MKIFLYLGFLIFILIGCTEVKTDSFETKKIEVVENKRLFELNFSNLLIQFHSDLDLVFDSIEFNNNNSQWQYQLSEIQNIYVNNGIRILSDSLFKDNINLIINVNSFSNLSGKEIQEQFIDQITMEKNASKIDVEYHHYIVENNVLVSQTENIEDFGEGFLYYFRASYFMDNTRVDMMYYVSGSNSSSFLRLFYDMVALRESFSVLLV